MLRVMRISDFAIIDSLEVDFGEGLNVLTGETGAGKSIIFEALHLTLGGRARADLVRSGAKEALVESLFELPGTPGGLAARAALEKAGIGVAEDGELIVRRIVSAAGRSRIYLNGSLVTAATLSSAGEARVNIHGQHPHHTRRSFCVSQPRLERTQHAHLGTKPSKHRLQRAHLDWVSQRCPSPVGLAALTSHGCPGLTKHGSDQLDLRWSIRSRHRRTLPIVVDGTATEGYATARWRSPQS